MAIAIAGGQLYEAKPVAMRVEPHGFGIYRDDIPKIEPIGQLALMRWDIGWGAPAQAPACVQGCGGGETGTGAQEKTRTSTTFRPQVPETCASANSATWATGGRDCGWLPAKVNRHFAGAKE